MSAPDTRPELTRGVDVQRQLVELQTEAIATGQLPASTALFLEVCRLVHAVERLHRVVELELSVRLAEEGGGAARRVRQAAQIRQAHEALAVAKPAASKGGEA